ncbi:Integral membrane protein TerC [Labilithrix luteola]|uniref:Integral membrane protein TerC n=1 Tax=Labilithrix luteola TaxID=1391654 RepID=A0A0K1Q813_9BACT|nr:TerC/Alx family metal homeostasis membrane protein [Labilithrix luteola]AKV01550.1 Integral membrane protein TerC [Labilithrix luteola]
MDVPPTAWIVLGITVVVALAVDLLAHRGGRLDSQRSALAFSGAWVALSILFGLGVTITLGKDAGAEFASAYLLEKSLSVDNLLVFYLVFSRLSIPAAEQRRVLFWGVLGAIAARGFFVAVGIEALHRWSFVGYGLGLLLVASGIKLLLSKPHDEDSRLLRFLRKHLRTTDLRGHHFFVQEEGRWRATPLFLALVAVEVLDILFAMDSIPAAFAVTDSAFILYASNVLAILGLRALYLVLADVLARLHLLRFGLAAALVFVGFKMLAAGMIHIPAGISLAVIVVCIGSSVIASRLRRERVSAIDEQGAG